MPDVGGTEVGGKLLRIRKKYFSRAGERINAVRHSAWLKFGTDDCLWVDHFLIRSVRNRGYYVTGSRIGLDVVIYDFRRGRSPEGIFEAYPSIGSLAKVYGAIAFILDHPVEVESYLTDQDRILNEIKADYPMPQEMIERFEQGKKETPHRLA